MQLSGYLEGLNIHDNIIQYEYCLKSDSCNEIVKDNLGTENLNIDCSK